MLFTPSGFFATEVLVPLYRFLEDAEVARLGSLLRSKFDRLTPIDAVSLGLFTSLEIAWLGRFMISRPTGLAVPEPLDADFLSLPSLDGLLS